MDEAVAQTSSDGVEGSAHGRSRRPIKDYSSPQFDVNDAVMKDEEFNEQTRHSSRPATSRPRRRVFTPRIAASLICLACVVFVGGFAAFANHVSNMRTPGKVPEADAIIVLTGGQSRLDAAVGLLKAGKGKRLLISGVNPVARADDLRAATGSEKWLFTCCVDIDRRALDTIGNAEESAKWVNANTFANVILVTNNYHMPRSLLEMNRLVRHVDVRPYPVVNTPLDDGGWLTKPDAIRVLFTEYTKYLAALARGMVPGREGPEDFTVVRAADGSPPVQ